MQNALYLTPKKGAELHRVLGLLAIALTLAGCSLTTDFDGVTLSCEERFDVLNLDVAGETEQASGYYLFETTESKRLADSLRRIGRFKNNNDIGKIHRSDHVSSNSVMLTYTLHDETLRTTANDAIRDAACTIDPDLDVQHFPVTEFFGDPDSANPTHGTPFHPKGLRGQQSEFNEWGAVHSQQQSHVG